MTAEQIADAIKQVALITGGMAQNAAHIAHCRRRLYEAYLAEGFTEAQALELAKVLTLS